MAKTDKNLKTAFASESQTNIEYLAYAHKAIDEGLMEIAQLFREAAGAEIVHVLSHLKAMGVVGTTKENLRETTEGKSLFSLVFSRQVAAPCPALEALNRLGDVDEFWAGALMHALAAKVDEG